MNVTLRAALIPLSLVALSLSGPASSQSTGGTPVTRRPPSPSPARPTRGTS
ncbi:hypothetical protein ACFQDE_21510 [Deinococcus caeni]|uniref:hypothetical protein n=1 Tax=Deinococcus caeni TaxID=569127 RepID=UPI00361F6B36